MAALVNFSCSFGGYLMFSPVLWYPARRRLCRRWLRGTVLDRPNRYKASSVLVDKREFPMKVTGAD